MARTASSVKEYCPGHVFKKSQKCATHQAICRKCKRCLLCGTKVRWFR